jgi:hypothetical protein
VSKHQVAAKALNLFFAFLFAFVGGGCAHETSKPIDLATPRPSALSSSPCPFFADMYSVSAASFDAHHATSKERSEILRWDAKVSAQNRKYVRWMRRSGLIISLQSRIMSANRTDPPTRGWR